MTHVLSSILRIGYVVTVISVVSFQVLGRCFLTVMQVHFQFLSQALQKVQPVAQSCLAEALAQAQERCANARSQSSDLGPLTELEEASRSWKGAAQVCSNRAPPGTLPGLGLGNMGFCLCEVKSCLVPHSLEIPPVTISSLNFPFPLFWAAVCLWTRSDLFCTPLNLNPCKGGSFVRGPD